MSTILDQKGIWNVVWLGPFRVQLKAPWYPPLFSERYGLKRHIPLGFGWRVAVFLVRGFR
jgi:hypothetical protein